VDFLKNARFLARTKTILLLRTGSGNCVMAGGMHSSVSLFFPPKDLLFLQLYCIHRGEKTKSGKRQVIFPPALAEAEGNK
jgi:hypothetical protein